MTVLLRHLLGWLTAPLRTRESLILENLALRQQLLALRAKRPRLRLGRFDRLFWIARKRLWSGWRGSLILVTPDTVVRWHRAGFRSYWAWLSRTGCVGGRRPMSKGLRSLIFRMVAENPTWGAPRIHGELLKLGFEVSERSVSR
jgi:putative transposase